MRTNKLIDKVDRQIVLSSTDLTNTIPDYSHDSEGDFPDSALVVETSVTNVQRFFSKLPAPGRSHNTYTNY